MRILKRIVMATGLLIGSLLLTGAPVFAQAPNSQGVSVASEQVLAVPSQGGNTLQAMLTVSMQNSTAGTQDILFNLPVGSTSPRLAASSAKQIALTAKGQVKVSVPAHGTTTFAVLFSSPLNQNGTELTWQNNLAVQRLLFIIPEGALTVSAQGGFQTDSATIFSGKKAYREFTKLGLPADSSWTVSVALLPTANGKQASALPGVRVLSSYGQTTANLEAIFNLILVVFILGMGIVSIRMEGGLRTSGDVTELTQQKERVFTHWVNLEEAYANGAIEQADYLKRRERFKRRAIELETALRQGQSS